MGRHSKPGPGESFGDRDEPADQPESPTGRFARPGDGFDHGDTGDGADNDDYQPSPLTDTARRRIAAFEGGHRSEGGRRGVSIGVIVALITVVVVVGAVILWRFFGDALSHRSADAAQQCLDGTVNVGVVADPSIAADVTKFADSFNAVVTPVGDRCVKMVVTAADSDQVVDGFVADWPGDLGERPALWIPASSIATARLQAAAGKEAVSDARSLVSSPVVLAVRPQLKDALAQQGWAALPGLQNDPGALDALNLPGWGSLRLALPTVGNAGATYLTAEAVAAASAPAGAPATAGLGAVNALVAGQPKLADNSADTAFTTLLSPDDPAGAPVHAVATTEQQLFSRASTPDAKDSVAEWLPPGPVAVADYPTVLLSGTWLSGEQVSAASEFARFMRKPEQLTALAKAGFRAEGTTAPGNDVVTFPALGPPLSVGDDSVRATLAAAVSSPATGSATTIMLDQGMGADEGGRSRLANVVTALANRIGALPPNAAVGLWTFNGVEGRSAVPMGPVSDQVDGQPRSAALTGTLTGLTPSGSGAVSFTTLRLVYGDALANFRQGQANSVLVITEGPHTDQTLDGPGLVQYVKSAVDPARPVAINVIDIGDDSDRETWEAVTQASGGTYQNVATSDSPDLATAVTTLLS
ncbi:substrate-binding domain-containing protein [Mycobacterium sp. CVI_P3]|uniref:Substrate-binding domain-containing protein n=1 Tax=Mycobacterium pinniadriaticum TaxID=2994102 RepID=A0ABT3S9B2_9MYCO|nr:substrate-binding domain-containing protein [Mycobacterium pinniadriaticum]MCX2929668.1 substrate-binding domain-containing protein [Mycobacterium pinniadriaticum]MCX2936092.1 substrate-binding domain-containing protein [Mycobacterium pinniadriaticum]